MTCEGTIGQLEDIPRGRGAQSAHYSRQWCGYFLVQLICKLKEKIIIKCGFTILSLRTGSNEMNKVLYFSTAFEPSG